MGGSQVLLTALQLQSAHLSVHGILGQVHVTGDGGGDAVMFRGTVLVTVDWSESKHLPVLHSYCLII